MNCVLITYASDILSGFLVFLNLCESNYSAGLKHKHKLRYEWGIFWGLLGLILRGVMQQASGINVRISKTLKVFCVVKQFLFIPSPNLAQQLLPATKEICYLYRR